MKKTSIIHIALIVKKAMLQWAHSPYTYHVVAACLGVAGRVPVGEVDAPRVGRAGRGGRRRPIIVPHVC